MTVAGAFCCNKPIFIYISNLIVIRTEAAQRCNVFMRSIGPYCRCLKLPGLAFFLCNYFRWSNIKPDKCRIIFSNTFCTMFDPLFQNGKLPAVRIEYLAASVVNLFKRFLEKEAGVDVVYVDARFVTLQQVLMVGLEVVPE